jgi:signal transduction histidine kinase
VDHIRTAARSARDLTTKLLALGRKQVLQMRVLNLTETVSDLMRMLSRTLGEDIEIVTRLDPTLGSVKADPHQIEQILLNLALNSRDAMPDGGQLTIETANVLLDEEYSQTHPDLTPGTYVLLSVTDTGSGMDAETLSHLFEPFFTTKPRGKGTGLGLATVYGVVRQHGGHVYVYSEPSLGTTFKVYLPRVPEPPDKVAAPPPEAEDRRGTETVLIVEDSEMVLNYVRDVLAAHGYKTFVAPIRRRRYASPNRIPTISTSC